MFRTGSGLLGLAFVAASALAVQAQDWTLNVNDSGFDPSPAGTVVEYQVRVNNNTHATTPEAAITFAIPDGAVYRGLVAGGDFTACLPTPDVTGPDEISCTVPELPDTGAANGVLLLQHLVEGTRTLTSTVISPDGAHDAPTPVIEDTTIGRGADLAAAITGPAVIDAGSIVEIAATITNHGPHESLGSEFSLTLPDGVSPDVTLPAGCSIAGMQVTCAVGPIAVDGDVTLVFETQVTTDDSSTLPFAGSVTSTTPGDGDGSNNAADFLLDVNPGTDVFLGKTRAPMGAIFVGDAVTFTLTPGHAGWSPEDATITDTLPANYDLVAVTPTPGSGWSCSATGRDVTCAFDAASVASPDFAAPITMTTTAVTATQGIGAPPAPVVNSATIDSSTNTITTNDTATDGGTSIIRPFVDLVARKTGPQHGLVVEGQAYDWRLSTRNAGNKPFWGPLEFVDHLPSGLEVTAIGLPPGWTCDAVLPLAGPADITCTTDKYTEGAPLGVGATSDVVTLTANVLHNTGGDSWSIANVLAVDSDNYNFIDPDLGNNTTSTTVGAGQNDEIADVRALKGLISPSPVAAGDAVSFRIEVINDGPATARDIVIEDTIGGLYPPPGGGPSTTLGPVTGGLSCTITPQADFSSRLRCTLDELPICTAGSCPTVDLTALVGGDAGAKTNTANAFSATTPDPDYTNNQAVAPYDVTARTVIEVEKFASVAADGAIPAGQKLIYEIQAIVPENGLSGAEGVEIRDTLPAGLLFVDATTTDGICAAPTGLDASGVTTATSELVCALDPIPNGVRRTASVTVVPTTAIVGTNITNSASISTTTPEIDPAAPHSATISHDVTPPDLDLVINKTDGPDPIEVGEDTTYTITVENSGPSDAFNLVITDTFPDAEGFAYLSTTPGPGMTCSSSATEAICEVAHLEAGQTVSFTIDMTAAKRGVWTNTVEVRSDEYGSEPNTANNKVSENTTVRDTVTLGVTKVATAPGTPAPITETDLRAPFDWLIEVSNAQGIAENVVIADTLPAGMELAGAPSITPGAGATCTGAAGDAGFSCTVDELVGGTGVTIRLPVVVTGIAASPVTLTNTVVVTTDSFDSNATGGENAATGTIDVLGAVISGSVWADFNRDDTRNGDDIGVGGITITATGTDALGNPVTQTVTTAADGSYEFDLLPPGTYDLSYDPADLPSGFDSRNAVAGSAGGTPDASFTLISNVPATSGTPATGYDFVLDAASEIALAKQATSSVLQPDGSYLVSYVLRLKNNSGEPISGARIYDDLVSGFGARASTNPPEADEYRVVSATIIEGAGLSFTTFDVIPPPPTPRTPVAYWGTVAVDQTVAVSVVLHVNPPLPRPGATLDLVNNARATGTGAWSGETLEDDSNDGATPVAGTASDTIVTLNFTPEISLAKEATLTKTGEAPAAGDRIDYTFTVKNTGDTPLRDVTIDDPLPDLVWDSATTIPLLEPGDEDSTSFAAHYILTAGDIAAGSVDNTATATGTWADGTVADPTVSDDASASVTTTPEPGITIEKALVNDAVGDPPAVGDVLRYGFTVTNTGNVDLHDVTVTDPLDGLADGTITIGDLAAGASVTVETDYSLTLAALNAGQVINQASVTATHGPGDTPIGADSNEVIVPLGGTPALRIEKVATSVPADPVPGDEVTWIVTITNDGTVALVLGTITEPLAGATMTAPGKATLGPGEDTTFTVSYALTQADIDAGRIENQVLVSASTPDGGTTLDDVPSNDPDTPAPGDPTVSPLDQGPAILLDKIADDRDITDPAEVGQPIHYTFRITNAGNVTLRDITVDDVLPGVTLTGGPIAELAPGDSSDAITGTYLLTAADITAGKVVNHATATGWRPAANGGTAPLTSAESSTSTPLSSAPGTGDDIRLDKIASAETAMIGDIISYTITITPEPTSGSFAARLVDTLPEGFVYRPDTARLDGVAVTPVVSGRRITLAPVAITPGTVREFVIEVMITSSARPGVHLNRARLLDEASGRDLAGEARAAVRILPDPVFQCATVIGRVFDDVDQNGHMSQSAEERGIPNVRLVSPRGLAITTDEHGRFSVPCAALPRAIGSNFMLKLDERTLPAGYRLTTENPRVVRLTPGMITRLDFGATMARLVRIDLSAGAFQGGHMRPELVAGLDRLVDEIHNRLAMVRLTYVMTPGEADGDARAALATVRGALKRRWPARGRYQLNVETRIERAGAVK